MGDQEFKIALDEGSGEEESTDVDVESRTKKRKRLKTFREYTNPKDAEGKFKGWSVRAANDMRDSIAILGILWMPKIDSFVEFIVAYTGKTKAMLEERKL